MSRIDLSQLSMLDLFRVEAETQAQVLTAGLLALERDPALADQLEACMRAAHSLKGAARIVGLNVGVRLAHAMKTASGRAGSRLTFRHAPSTCSLGPRLRCASPWRRCPVARARCSSKYR
jgi:two-component system sensor histidine kinase and response regulator WspE